MPTGPLLVRWQELLGDRPLPGRAASADPAAARLVPERPGCAQCPARFAGIRRGAGPLSQARAGHHPFQRLEPQLFLARAPGRPLRATDPSLPAQPGGKSLVRARSRRAGRPVSLRGAAQRRNLALRGAGPKVRGPPRPGYASGSGTAPRSAGCCARWAAGTTPSEGYRPRWRSLCWDLCGNSRASGRRGSWRARRAGRPLP